MRSVTPNIRTTLSRASPSPKAMMARMREFSLAERAAFAPASSSSREAFSKLGSTDRGVTLKVNHSAMSAPIATPPKWQTDWPLTVGDLHEHLRCRKKNRRRYGTYKKRSPIAGRIGIEERPAVVDTRRRVGDWEADTIVGKPGTAVIVSLVDRRSRLTCLAKASSRKASEVEKAIKQALGERADHVHTVTCDNGSEFARHASLSASLKARFFFAHPYAAWERGLNENTNGLVRQYFQKGTDFTHITQQQVQQIMNKLNRRPRKALGYRTPIQAFLEDNATVALQS